MRDADPVTHEPGLSAVDAQVMRRAVIAATGEPRATSLFWPGPVLVATAIAVTLVAGVVVGRWLPARQERSAGSAGGPEAGARRQLYFATRGGTRVIWVFDPEFQP